jgi:rare lipoprotein A
MNAALPRALHAGAVLLAVLALAACGSAPKKQSKEAGQPVAGGKMEQASAGGAVAAGCSGASPYAAAQEDPSTRGDYTAGGLYKPGVKDTTPRYVPNVACIPEPLVTDEPRSPVGNRSPYTVLGKQYHVLDRPRGYAEQGTASYYGAKFHGRRTSNQEVYDMYAFTAAHKTLPLPSFARVTNLDNGRSVVVRVNDRGPFHEGRVIDLSYAAAVKLGIVARGTGRVEVRALSPGDADAPRGAAAKRSDASAAAASTTVAALPATGLDNLVQALPPAPAATTVSAPLPGAGDAGAAVLQAGGTTSAVATAIPAVTGAGEPVATQAAPGVAQSGSYGPAMVPAAVGIAPAGRARAGSASASDTELQVASFSNLDNARRALDRLLAAGIDGARLDDVVAGGRTFWRLRVASGGSDAVELAGRIAGLGFGTPQLVSE